MDEKTAVTITTTGRGAPRQNFGVGKIPHKCHNVWDWGQTEIIV